MKSFSENADLFSGVELLGDAPAVHEVRLRAIQASLNHLPVLILGERGSGKETVARLIHQQSSRGAMPFIPADCAAIPDRLFERELFGCAARAFENKKRDSLGAFRCARGGTIYLDEVSELSAPLQQKVSNSISVGYTVPVGDYRPESLDVRLICSSHQSIQEMVADGLFDPDLFAQISAIVIEMPALRDRARDILPLADHFLKLQSHLNREPGKSISAEAARLLEACSWPGNVRELFEVMEQAHILAEGSEITPGDLPPQLQYLG
jgi:DNA-binding NtrC family response regulator